MNYPKAKEEREQYGERYLFAIDRIDRMVQELKSGESVVPQNMQDFFLKVSEFILLVDETYHLVESGKLYTLSWSSYSKSITICTAIFCRDNMSRVMPILLTQQQSWERSMANICAFCIRSFGAISSTPLNRDYFI
jgi:hypothetical protein